MSSTTKQEEYLRDILDSGRHLLSLINDILDLSKVEAGRMELELGRFSLPEALENGLTMVRERASRHGIALSLEVDPAIDVIEADERKVKQVVFNLLSNAVKFTPDGGQVGITARLEAAAVRITVWDTGIGIAPEDQGRIFEEFQQVGGLRWASGRGNRSRLGAGQEIRGAARGTTSGWRARSARGAASPSPCRCASRLRSRRLEAAKPHRSRDGA